MQYWLKEVFHHIAQRKVHPIEECVDTIFQSLTKSGIYQMNAGFVLDDFATHIDKKELSFRHPYIYTGMAIAAVGVMIANKHYGFGLY